MSFGLLQVFVELGNLHGCSSKFREGSRVSQKPEEGRRTYRPERYGNNNNNKDEDDSPKTLNDKNLSLRKFSLVNIILEYKLFKYDTPGLLLDFFWWGEGFATGPETWVQSQVDVVAIEKGAFWSPSITVANFTYFILT